jgi:hypothetical protein
MPNAVTRMALACSRRKEWPDDQSLSGAERRGAHSAHRIISDMTPSEHFERELETFRREAEAGTQFLFAYLTVHAVAHQHKAVLALLNRTPLFWNTCLGALQTSAFIALGRIFDSDSPHNISQLFRIAQDNRAHLFSKAALEKRKQGNSPEPPEWLPDFMQDVHEPTPDDFRRLRRHVQKWRRIYEANYRDVRNKYFAHKVVADEAETAVLFSKGTNRELQRLFAFLGSLYEALWELFMNGRKPVLRPRRYSVKRMRGQPSPPFLSHRSVQEHITHEAEKFLKSASRT